jgi:hypothetical protein
MVAHGTMAANPAIKRDSGSRWMLLFLLRESLFSSIVFSA